MHDSETNLITRRRSLGLLGSGGAALWLAGSGLSSAIAATREGHDYVADARACTLTAEQEEGPFYVAVDKVRSDIALGRSSS